jgi:hypothetical protein
MLTLHFTFSQGSLAPESPGHLAREYEVTKK